MNTLRLALCFDTSLLSSRRNIPEPQANILVLPELADTGYRQVYDGVVPHTQSDSYYKSLQLLSARSIDTIVAGSMYFRDKKKNANSSFVFHKGSVIHRYDKIHLFQPCRDHEYFVAGGKNTSFTISLDGDRLSGGVILCYDLRFPELVRVLAAKGIQILFVPARWPKIRDGAWSSLLKARAIENQIFVVGCNANDNEGGYSYVFSPTGELLYSNVNSWSDKWATVDLELNLLEHAKTSHINIADAVFLRSLLKRQWKKPKRNASAPTKKRRGF